MYARLVAPPTHFPEPLRRACVRIVDAMQRYPEMIGGTSERLDTEVMRAARGQVISKVGAEGVYTAGILPSKKWPLGLGLALKIEDGEDKRARPTVVIEALAQLGALDDEAKASLARYATFPIKNYRREVVGEVRPAFQLETIKE
ncbi:MAG: asparaginase [Pyrinomonadaceae bacterium]